MTNEAPPQQPPNPALQWAAGLHFSPFVAHWPAAAEFLP
jgi:hypothetical protein